MGYLNDDEEVVVSWPQVFVLIGGMHAAAGREHLAMLWFAVALVLQVVDMMLD